MDIPVMKIKIKIQTWDMDPERTNGIIMILIQGQLMLIPVKFPAIIFQQNISKLQQKITHMDLNLKILMESKFKTTVIIFLMVEEKQTIVKIVMIHSINQGEGLPFPMEETVKPIVFHTPKHHLMHLNSIMQMINHIEVANTQKLFLLAMVITLEEITRQLTLKAIKQGIHNIMNKGNTLPSLDNILKL